MASHLVSLLKLIDLAIGSPGTGSVSFNLLHKILYILAVRDGSAESEEIELCLRTDSEALTLNDITGRNVGSQTRLMVQRIHTGANSDEHRLKITGSRIVVPWEERQQVVHENQQMESRMSEMSSVVSNLEGRMQEMTENPTDGHRNVCEELQRRIETLEGLVEQQTAQVAVQQSQQEEQPDYDGGISSSEQWKNDVWDAINVLQTKVDELMRATEQHRADAVREAGNFVTQQTEDITEQVIYESGNTGDDDDIRASVEKAVKQTSGNKCTEETFQEIQFRQAQLEDTLGALLGDVNTLKRVRNPDEIDFNGIVALEQLTERVLHSERASLSKIKELENLISRLFQEKADDVGIESRVRQSLELASRMSRQSIELTSLGAEISRQMQPSTEERISALSAQIKSNQQEVTVLREGLQEKANADYIISLKSSINEEIQQLRDELELIRKPSQTSDELAAGAKQKLIRNVRCISCDRSVAMDPCDEVIPKPVALAVSRKLKPNLHSQLQEMRKNLERRPEGVTPLGNINHFEKIYRLLASRKQNRNT